MTGLIRGLFALILFVMGLLIFGGGIYCGIVSCLIGGIIDIINQVKAPVTEAAPIAWAIVKIVFCEVPIYLGVVIGVILCSGAVATLKD